MITTPFRPATLLVAALAACGPAMAAAPAELAGPQVEISPELQERMTGRLQLRRLCWTEIRREKTESGIVAVPYQHCTLARD